MAVGTNGDVYVARNESKHLEVFKPFLHTLTITAVESGTVECEAEGTVSFKACEAGYAEGHVVKLRAVPGAHFSFAGWSEVSGSGAVAVPCAGVVVECEVVLDADVSGKATFVHSPQVPLTVSSTGAGSGAILSVPGGIECGSVCEAEFETGAVVTLEATAASGSTFVEWVGCDSVSGSVCHVTMEEARTAHAVFAIAQDTLTVTKTGTGGGAVVCDGEACAASYPQGTVLTLAASPSPGSTFAGWSGAGCAGTASCTITLDADTSVVATFAAKPAEAAPQPTVTPPPPALGVGQARLAEAVFRVTSSRASIKLTCAGAGPCKGVLKLYASVPQGSKGKKVTRLIGESSFSIGQGKSQTVTVKIANSRVKTELDRDRAVKVQVKGTAVKSGAGTLKPAAKPHKGRSER